jgi:hypothetical protein
MQEREILKSKKKKPLEIIQEATLPNNYLNYFNPHSEQAHNFIKHTPSSKAKGEECCFAINQLRAALFYEEGINSRHKELSKALAFGRLAIESPSWARTQTCGRRDGSNSRSV